MRKNQRNNIIFIIVLAVIVLTPIRTHLQVWVNRIFSFSPSIEKKSQQVILENYNWEMVEENGQLYNLKEDENSVILINYWATWCPPCIAEMPSLQNLYNDYRDKMKFIFVTNDKQENVQKFLAENEYNLPIFYPNSTTPEPLEADRIPATFLISKDHKIMVHKIGAADWNSKAFRQTLDSLIGER